MLPKGSRVSELSQKTLTKRKQSYKTVPRALRAYNAASNDTVTPQPTRNCVLLEFLCEQGMKGGMRQFLRSVAKQMQRVMRMVAAHIHNLGAESSWEHKVT